MDVSPGQKENGWPVGPKCEILGPSYQGVALRWANGWAFGPKDERRQDAYGQQMPTLRSQAGCLRYNIHFAAGRLPFMIV